MTKGEPIPGDSSFADFSKIRLKKVNRTHILIGEAEFFRPVTNDIQCKILLYKKQGGEYRLTSFKVPVKGFCDFYNSEALVVPDFQNHCPECPKQEENLCPWKAVNISLEVIKCKKN